MDDIFDLEQRNPLISDVTNAMEYFMVAGYVS